MKNNFFQLQKTWISFFFITIFIVELIRTAWISDDAGFTIRTVSNLINGDGAVFNIGERVQAYTHPLWFLLLSIFSYVNHDVIYVVFILSILCSVLSLWFFICKISTSQFGYLLATSSLIFSKAFLDYSTSGLENPLSHLCILITVYAAFRFEAKPNGNNLKIYILMSAFVVLTRQDLAIIILPLSAHILYRAKQGKISLLFPVLIGLSPIILWEVFSILYYGFPFPNTAYAKLGSGIEKLDILRQGLYYFRESFLMDPLTLSVIMFGAILSAYGSRIIRSLGLGILLYLGYILYIGGDFMAGRFFTVPLLFACIVIARTNFTRKAALFLATPLLTLSIWSFPNTIFSNEDYKPRASSYGVADERGVYYQRYGLLHFADKNPQLASSLSLKHNKEKEVYIICNAFHGLSNGRNMHIVDNCGLADPLLARLPARRDKFWRIGHFFREVPEGYIETIQSHQNVIKDIDTKKFYDLIRLITQDKIFTLSRMQAIFLINLNLVTKPQEYLYQFSTKLRPTKINEVISFSSETLTPRASGWQYRESWGTWSDGKNARLTILLPKIVPDSIMLNVRALVAGPLKCQQVIVEIHGKKKYEGCLDTFESNALTIPLSKANLSPEKPITIDFILPNAATPKSLGLSDTDEREIAIGLIDATFK